MISLTMIIPFYSYSQNQINLDVDNDLYFKRDFYYSSGIFLSFKSQKKQESKESINHFKIGQLIYTPSSRYETNPDKYDYPYSGYLFFEFKNQKRLSHNTSISLGGNIGMTGNASLAKGMQNLYHNIVLNLPNLEWKSQMPQELQVNFVGSFFKGFNLYDKINFTTNLHANIGTYQMMSEINFGVLIGDLGWSKFSDNIIDSNKNKFSFYVGSSHAYYFHDFKLEGSLFNNRASLTMPSKKYRNSLILGVKKRFNKLQILTTFNSISKDTELQRTIKHPFLKISLSYKFS